MNITYIKRQLVLNDLGIPMDKDVQEYVKYFNELIGDVDDLTREYGKYLNFEGHMYYKNGIKLLFYDKIRECFIISFTEIWDKFGKKFILSYSKITNLFTVLFEYKFKCNTNRVVHSIYSELPFGILK